MDLFQTAHLGKLPRNIMEIIRHYYDYKKYLIMYYLEGFTIYPHFVMANSHKMAIKQFVLGTMKSSKDIGMFMSLLNDVYEYEETIINACKINDDLLRYIYDEHIPDQVAFMNENFDRFVELIDKYKNYPLIRIMPIE